MKKKGWASEWNEEEEKGGGWWERRMTERETKERRSRNARRGGGGGGGVLLGCNQMRRLVRYHTDAFPLALLLFLFLPPLPSIYGADRANFSPPLSPFSDPKRIYLPPIMNSERTQPRWEESLLFKIMFLGGKGKKKKAHLVFWLAAATFLKFLKFFALCNSAG